MTNATLLRGWRSTGSFLIALALTFMIWTTSFGQVYQSENFDSYTSGDIIGVVGGANWNTWSSAPGGPEDAEVSDVQSFSPSNSLLTESQSTDLLYLLGDSTSGIYHLQMKIYIPEGNGNYYNLQKAEAPGTEWAVQITFFHNDSAEINYDGGVFPFRYTQDEWLVLDHYIDIDNDTAQFWMDGGFIAGWRWSQSNQGLAGLSQLGAIDFFPAAVAPPSAMYVDDIVFENGAGMFPASISSYNIEYWDGGDFMGSNDASWTTWSGTTGGTEDVQVTDTIAHSGFNSVAIEGSTTDVIFLLDDRTSGTYKVGYDVYVASGNSAYYNIQETMVPATTWILDGWLDDGGMGRLNRGTNNVANFSYPQDKWFSIWHYVDLDNDSIQVFVDNRFVYAGAYTANGGTTTLGSLNFYPDAGAGPGKVYFVDDMVFKPSQLRSDVTDYSIEAWTAGDHIAQVDASWATWSGTTGGSEDALVSTNQAQSGINSVAFDDAAIDNVFLLGNLTSDVWEVGFSMYIESGSSGYYNIQEDETPGVGWMMESYFDDDGTGYVEVGGVQTAFTYPQDVWFDVTHFVDLDNDSIQVLIDGMPAYASSYTPAGSSTQLGSFNFYPDGGNGTTKIYYIDDMVREPGALIVWPVGLRDQKKANVDFALYPNPANNNLTIANPFKGEINVSIKDAMGRQMLSHVSSIGSVRLDISGLEPGVYLVEVTHQDQRGVKKLIVE